MDVAEWLATLGLERYETIFRENDVSAAVVPNLTAEDLKDIGIRSVGHRRQLLDAIAELRTKAKPAGELVPPVLDLAVILRIDGSATTEMHRDRETKCREEVRGEAQRCGA